MNWGVKKISGTLQNGRATFTPRRFASDRVKSQHLSAFSARTQHDAAELVAAERLFDPIENVLRCASAFLEQHANLLPRYQRHIEPGTLGIFKKCRIAHRRR